MPPPEFAASFGRLAANHLWQSTGFAAVAVLLALALKANHARARYWLWLAASVKFLVPFSMLAAIGAGLGRWFAPATPVSRLPFVIEQIVQPFAPIQDSPLPVAASAPGTANLLPAMLLALWFCGFVAVLLYAWMRWRRVAAAVHLSTPLTEGRELEAWGRLAARQPARGPEGTPSTAARADWQSARSLASCPTEKGHVTIRLVSSTAKLEPGVFGIFRPVLWLPAGIGDRLENAELEAILSHELCHIRRRDNLLAAIHMAVEAIFWFHPLVWWLGARLEEERERACDEEVVRMGGEPHVYAESILKVCEFYLASPVACAAGVTGGELKKRIEGIMTNRFTCKLSFGKKLLLTAVATLVIAGPIVVGLLNPPRGQAQSKSGQATPVFEVASVKPNLSGDPGAQLNPEHGNFTAENASLRQLIRLAYHVPDFMISGPAWLDSLRYDINAKGMGDAPQSQVALMLRALLADRFHLQVHRETKEMSVYFLVVAKGGLKLQSADAPDPAPFPNLPPGPHGVMQAARISLADLAGNLSRPAGRPVLDRTGIQGTFRLRLWYTNNSESEGPDLFAALREQLGLRLEPGRGPVETLAVDHADKVPTPD
jgi:bla regulator protein BlaR1